MFLFFNHFSSTNVAYVRNEETLLRKHFISDICSVYFPDPVRHIGANLSRM